MADYCYSTINDIEASDLCDLVSFERDLEEAVRYAQLLIEELNALFNPTPERRANTDILNACSISAIIKYGRVVSSRDRRSSRIRKTILDLIPECFQAYHIDLITIRDRYVAHADNALEDGEAKAYYNRNDIAGGVTSIVYGHHSSSPLSIDTANKLIEISQILGQSIRAMIKEEQKRLLTYCRQLPMEKILSWEARIPDPFNEQLHNVRPSKKKPQQ